MNLKIEEAKREEGFTLIELLVVVIIIGILAAIAIPIFLNQRAQAWERTAQSDARNAAIVLESYMNDAFEYPNGGPNDIAHQGEYTSADATDLDNDEALTISPNVTLRYELDGQRYRLCTLHENLDDTNFVAVYDSGAGGILEDINRNATASTANCSDFDYFG